HIHLGRLGLPTRSTPFKSTQCKSSASGFSPFFPLIPSFTTTTTMNPIPPHLWNDGYWEVLKSNFFPLSLRHYLDRFFTLMTWSSNEFVYVERS
ncbi:hypothetical protein AVEN_10404-1, partial [Araneus ventricosus]